MASAEDILRKILKFRAFSTFKWDIKMCRNFNLEKNVFPKSANATHIFELLKRRSPMFNLKAKYENSLGGRLPPYFLDSDYSQKILKRITTFALAGILWEVNIARFPQNRRVEG